MLWSCLCCQCSVCRSVLYQINDHFVVCSISHPYSCLLKLKKRQYLLVVQIEKEQEYVNIFHKNIYYLTILLSVYYKTYCFAFQKRRFCTVKAAVLHCKTYAFAMPNRNYRFSNELSLQNQSYCGVFTLSKKKKINSLQ